MKYSVIYICIASMLCFTHCSDYLDTTNPGKADDAFVTSNPDEVWKMLSWAYAEYRANVAAGGNYNFQDPLGSDAEYLNEYPTQQNNIVARLQAELTPITMMNGQFNSLNTVLARAARIAAAIAENEQYRADAAGNEPTVWTHLYGEAITLWAHCYFKLATHFGDVPFGYENRYVLDYVLTSRFDIYDNILAELKSVEGKMFALGQGGITAERMSRSYANALIGQIALYAGSWMTIRTDIPELYGDVQFDFKGEDDGKCVYARRKDYSGYIQEAETYLNAAMSAVNGTAILLTEDDRTDIDNPFQLHWREINSRRISKESLFEVGCLPGIGQGELPYSQGRPGSNNSKNSLLNTFAAIRIIPSFFYNAYEPGDKRRDASMVVTGSDASTGDEALLTFGVSTRIGGGGPATNKWDHNKADKPDLANATFRSSGMNYTVLRMADVMLMLAEAKAILGTDNAGAIALVNQIRARAFGDNTHGIGNPTGDALLDAIYAERKLELLSEGAIRWDMIRSGKFNERAVKVRQEMVDVIDGLRADGYYTFPSGRTISKYVWTKKVYLDGVSSTGVTYDSKLDETDPVRTPGWRGIWTWNNIGYASTPHNLAIKGLYTYIDPDGPEAAALVSEGYTRANWGQNILNDVDGGRNIYDLHILDGVKGRENKAPRYFHPIPLTVIEQSKGKVTNGYGLPQQ